MANAKRAGLAGTPMSRGEVIGGFVYFPFYIFLLGWLLGLLLHALGDPLTASAANTVYFLINFLIVALIFRRWLIASLSAVTRQFWSFLQAAVLGFAFYYALLWVLTWALELLEWTVANPNDAYVSELAGGSVRWALVCTVLLAPLVEETLFRGLIFGNLRPLNRAAAYIVSALVFAAVHVWQYAGSLGWRGTLLCAVQYIPAGLALGWTYEKSAAIWAPILVHACINAVSMGLLW